MAVHKLKGCVVIGSRTADLPGFVLSTFVHHLKAALDFTAVFIEMKETPSIFCIAESSVQSKIPALGLWFSCLCTGNDVGIIMQVLCLGLDRLCTWKQLLLLEGVWHLCTVYPSQGLSKPHSWDVFAVISHRIIQDIESQSLICCNADPCVLQFVFPSALAGPVTELLSGSSICRSAAVRLILRPL